MCVFAPAFLYHRPNIVGKEWVRWPCRADPIYHPFDQRIVREGVEWNTASEDLHRTGVFISSWFLHDRCRAHLDYEHRKGENICSLCERRDLIQNLWGRPPGRKAIQCHRVTPCLVWVSCGESEICDPCPTRLVHKNVCLRVIG